MIKYGKFDVWTGSTIVLLSIFALGTTQPIGLMNWTQMPTMFYPMTIVLIIGLVMIAKGFMKKRS